MVFFLCTPFGDGLYLNRKLSTCLQLFSSSHQARLLYKNTKGHNSKKNVGGDNVCFCASADYTLYSLLSWPTFFPLMFGVQYFN